MDEGYFKENDFATEASKRIDAFENYSKEYIQTQNAIKLVALVDNFKQFVEWLEGHFLDWKGRKLQQIKPCHLGGCKNKIKTGRFVGTHCLAKFETLNVHYQLTRGGNGIVTKAL